MDPLAMLMLAAVGAIVAAIVGALARRLDRLTIFAGFVAGIAFPLLAVFLVGSNDYSIVTAAVVGPALAASLLILLRAPSPSALARHQAPLPSQHDKVFISYRRDDSLETTGRIYDRLSREYGEGKAFRDLDSMPFGIDFREHIDKRLGDCNICFVVLGPKFLSVTDKSGAHRIDDPRDHVRIEIETALRRNIRVVPLLVGGASMPAESQLPTSLAPLAYRAGTSIRPDPDFHRDIDRLMAGLRSS